MRDLERLGYSLLSVDDWIEDHVNNEITRPYKSCEDIGKLLWALNGFYRTRGILKQLLHGDTDAFFADLAREALTYVTLLSAYQGKLDVPVSRVNGSTYSPLTCALACANFQLAAEIDGLMPRQFGKHDDEVLFAFASVLRRLVVGSREQIDEARLALLDASPGVEMYEAVSEIVRGLTEESDEIFNSGLTAYMTYAEDPSPEEREDLDPGEEFVSIEGLAFIQLAKQRNLKTRVQHRMIPPELQEARMVVPTDGYPAWPG